MKKLFTLLLVFFSLCPIAFAGITQNNISPSQAVINHQALQTFLDRNVETSADNRTIVHYSKVTIQDRELLVNYLHYLSTIPFQSYSNAEQLAFWINLYNALTINLILKNFPVRSILDIHFGDNWVVQFIYPGPWEEKLITLNNSVEYSLNDIEHQMIRKKWRDPRIHYALNCASIGCPKLQKKVYQGATLNDQLNQAARDYINSPHGITIINNQLIGSKIYLWYAEDFGKNQQEIIEHLKWYANPKLKSQLNQFKHFDDYKYDWSLNGD